MEYDYHTHEHIGLTWGRPHRYSCENDRYLHDTTDPKILGTIIVTMNEDQVRQPVPEPKKEEPEVSLWTRLTAMLKGKQSEP